MKMKITKTKGYEIIALAYDIGDRDHEEAIEAIDANMRVSVAAVEDLLGYRFTDKFLLQEALTHPSYTESTSYQRLEFVGDAVLGMALTEFVFRSYPGLDPGQLSLVRAANISTEKLARVAVRHELYRYVRHSAPSLIEKVMEFVLAVEEEGDEVTYGGSVKAPKILADIVESVAAAIYVDRNYDLKALWEVFKGFMEPIVTLKNLQKQPQPVTLLFEFCQKQGKEVDIRHWRKGSRNIASVYVDRKLIASGSSEQKETAKLNAAKEALQILIRSAHLDMETEGGHGVASDLSDIEGAKSKLNELCGKKRWRQAKYKVEKEFGPAHGREFICSVQIETADGVYVTSGDKKPRIKDAESSAASMMLHGLEDVKRGVGLLLPK